MVCSKRRENEPVAKVGKHVACSKRREIGGRGGKTCNLCQERGKLRVPNYVWVKHWF